jgi:crossover junction endodeoxyribonuclease RuvC
MIFLGIDPGTAFTGYGVIQARNNAVSWVDCGVIVTEPHSPLPARLMKIYDGIRLCIEQHKPQRVSIEQAFYAKNVHTTLLLGHARGVAMLAAQQSGAEIAEYSPREIKKATTGNGNATKEQVEYMIKMLLSPRTTGERSDAWDALAVALCDFYNSGRRSMVTAVPGK